MVNYQQIKIEDIVVYDMQFFWFYWLRDFKFLIWFYLEDHASIIFHF